MRPHEQLAKLPKTIKARVAKRLERLESWPHVSGVKALSGDMAGLYRDRTGDYECSFTYIRPGWRSETGLQAGRFDG